MGKPMARRLVDGGYKVLVHSRSQPPVDELVAYGASAPGSTAQLAASSDIVITMLPDTPDVEDVVLGSGDVLEAARPGSLLVDMSTISPSTARRIAEAASERAVDALDAPVSGGEEGAIHGTLAIICGGDAAAVERARPVFSHLGSRVVHVGGPGAGQTVKACNQILVGITLQAIAEALVLSGKAGIDPRATTEALLGGLAQSRALEVKGPSLLRRDFAPGFRVELHHKDLGIALAAGAEFGATLPLAATVHEFLGALRSLGRGGLDHSALITLVEDLSDYHPEAIVEAP
jgi:2-hydroxy-3-oxopropionate reductase